MARLKELYRNDIRPALMERFGYTNIHQVPRLKKITLNIGVGYEGHMNKEIIEEAMRTLSAITGQQPVVTKSRKAVSNFRIRENYNIGVKVTLRDVIMYEFLDRLISVTIPRIRDFRGLNPRSFDGRGNYSLGVEEQNIFAEIDLDKVKHTLGMDVTFTIDSDGDRESYALMREFGMPFGREGDKYYDYEVREQIAAEKL
ncbi:MAG: 50S ribosomal protein L5 [Planctomycetota bacterium]|nr:50S ribosomal protein L5 [Planctomycetota bacterium]